MKLTKLLPLLALPFITLGGMKAQAYEYGQLCTMEGPAIGHKDWRCDVMQTPMGIVAHTTSGPIQFTHLSGNVYSGPMNEKFIKSDSRGMTYMTHTLGYIKFGYSQ